MAFRKRLSVATVAAWLAAVGMLAAPGQANAWWRGGFVGIGIAPVVVAPPVYVAPVPVVVAPPVVIAPPPVAYYPAPRVWIRPHWNGPFWVPGHWS
jgi:hypothetical protein